MADQEKGAPPQANDPKAVPKKKTSSPNIKVNKKGGAYVIGVGYSLDMKARFHHQLAQLKKKDGNVSCRELAAKAMISPGSALKIIMEDKQGIIGAPKKKRARPGNGSQTLSKEDETFILTQQELDPSTSLDRYKNLLCEQRGTVVSRSTLQRWFASKRKGKKKAQKKQDAKTYDQHSGYVANKDAPSAP
jgi:hypothetical protein